MIAASAFAPGRRFIGERRMVRRQQHRTLIVLLFDTLQLSRQEIQLDVRNVGPLFSFARNQSRIFQRIAEQSDNANEWCIQRENKLRAASSPYGGAIQLQASPWARSRRNYA